MYREENDQVVLTMSVEDYQKFLMLLGAGTAVLTKRGGIFDINNTLELLNRLNSGNPNYTPYQVEEKK